MPAMHGFRRGKATRKIGRRLIIVCEGKKTEVGYFEGIRKSMRLPTLQVKVVHPKATDPLSIVNEAIDLISQQSRDQWSSDDSAWAVFDGDEHRDKNPDNWNDAIQRAKSRKTNLAVSNPCFELWYLLHYQDQLAKLSRHEATKRLLVHLPNYDKAEIYWPHPLERLSQAAVERAMRLAQKIDAGGNDVYCNPSTYVFHLFSSLAALDEESKQRPK